MTHDVSDTPARPDLAEIDEQIVLDGSDDRLYEAGLTVAHSSDEDGMPDVGMSVGLGGGRMLYVGDVPGLPGDGLKLYGQQDDSTLIASSVDRGAAYDLLGVIASALLTAATERETAALARAEVMRRRAERAEAAKGKAETREAAACKTERLRAKAAGDACDDAEAEVLRLRQALTIQIEAGRLYREKAEADLARKEAALRAAKALMNDMNEFGACSDGEIFDAAWTAVASALASTGGSDDA